MTEEDPHMPKWALDPLLTETTPLQGGGGGGEGHGSTSNGGGHDEGDSDGDYDSDYSEEDLGRYSGVRTVRRGCLLDSFLALNALTVIVALGVAAAQALVLAYHSELTLFAELEWTQTVREMFVLHAWIPRGVLYSFVGVLVLEEEDEKNLDLGMAGIYITVIAWTMVGIGALYFLMGICCLKRVRDKRMARHKTLVAHAEMQEAIGREEAGV